jgi:hypothetical protein
MLLRIQFDPSHNLQKFRPFDSNRANSFPASTDPSAALLVLLPSATIFSKVNDVLCVKSWRTHKVLLLGAHVQFLSSDGVIDSFAMLDSGNIASSSIADIPISAFRFISLWFKN